MHVFIILFAWKDRTMPFIIAFSFIIETITETISEDKHCDMLCTYSLMTWFIFTICAHERTRGLRWKMPSLITVDVVET